MSTPAGSVGERPTLVKRVWCPSWCVTGHRPDLGEEDWLHTSEPVPLTPGLRAHLAMSTDPDSGEVDGPYVIIGDTEFTLAEASALATSLMALVSEPAAVDVGGRPSGGPPA